MQKTKIPWCDYTFNPWVGCGKASPGCANCYARAMETRWGRDFSERRRTSPDNWRNPDLWERLAFKEHKRPRVFCGSMCDWLDNTVPYQWTDDLIRLIGETPHIDWLMLTKRPENFHLRMNHIMLTGQNHTAYAWLRGEPPPNVWFGVTAENEELWDRRVDILRTIPARLRWVSAEPLLGPLSFRRGDADVVNWVVAGGENGRGARECRRYWIGNLRYECMANGTQFFFKQWGDNSTGTLPGSFSSIIFFETVREWPK